MTYSFSFLAQEQIHAYYALTTPLIIQQTVRFCKGFLQVSGTTVFPFCGYRAGFAFCVAGGGQRRRLRTTRLTLRKTPAILSKSRGSPPDDPLLLSAGAMIYDAVPVSAEGTVNIFSNAACPIPDTSVAVICRKYLPTLRAK